MVREISRLYRELAEIPLYVSAYFLNSSGGTSTIRTTSLVRDHLRNIKRTVSKHIVTSHSDVVVTSSQDDSALAAVPSPSGKRLGILREVSNGSSKKRFVEVWLGSRLEAAKDVTKIHDEFHVTSTFFSLSFSKSESALVYTAEARKLDSDETSIDVRDKFRFVPDYGEGLVGTKRPTLFLFRWSRRRYEDEAVELLETTSQKQPTVSALIPSLSESSALSFGQASFAPDERTIFATGYENTFDGRRLGVVWCWNHPSSIFKLQLPDEVTESEEISVHAWRLTPAKLSARSARVTHASPDGRYITVWLANPVGGPHASATLLYALRSDEDEPTILVDSVSEPRDRDVFPGLYVDELPSRPFLSLDSDSDVASHLVTQSVWGSRETVLGISLASGEVRDLTPGQGQTWKVAGTDGKSGVLATRSAIATPHELLETQLRDLGTALNWKVIDKPILTAWAREKLNSIESSVHSIPGRFPTEVLAFHTAGAKNLPLVTIPHGGPHLAYDFEFNPATVALALEGYVIGLVNYTGSLGFGQKHVDALMGRVGELDVKDCYHAAKHLIKIGLAQEGPGKQFVQGGSHGGFLSAHLIGQYPEFFSAAVMRNPVIAAGEIASVSDIPDWAFSEFGAVFGPKAMITAEVYEKLQSASPIKYVEAIKAPVLLLVGEADRRVPPSQAKNFYYALRGRQKQVEMLMFPGNGHSLDSVEAELAGWEAGRDWFSRFSR